MHIVYQIGNDFWAVCFWLCFVLYLLSMCGILLMPYELWRQIRFRIPVQIMIGWFLMLPCVVTRQYATNPPKKNDSLMTLVVLLLIVEMAVSASIAPVTAYFTARWILSLTSVLTTVAYAHLVVHVYLMKWYIRTR